MCGRFTITEIAKIVERFGLVLPDGTRIEPRFNVAPSQQIAVVVEGEDGRELRWMEWGFQPDWFTPQPNRPPPINARAETLLERPMFRGSVARQRCIIPADGFFEWQAVPGSRRRQPVYIRLKGGGVFGMAGLYTERPGAMPDERVPSCVIITTGPNELMAPIHDRMPVILDRADEATWLDPDVHDPVALMACLRRYPAEEMEAYPVSQLVSYTHNDEPALIRPLSEPRT
jgi:putative SOS response-associated peptidase YedK